MKFQGQPDDRAGDGKSGRFDPFEALDEIYAQLDCSRADYHNEKAICGVWALRSYIRGMEK